MRAYGTTYAEPLFRHVERLKIEALSGDRPIHGSGPASIDVLEDTTMPRPLTADERYDLLREPHVAVLSVASDDARPPLTVPVWYVLQPDGNLFFFTGTTGEPVRKTRLIQRSRAVTLVVQREQFPYRYVTVECRLAEEHQPPSAEQMRSVVSRYLPADATAGFVEGVLSRVTPHLIGFTLRPERWNALDFGE
jgi:nitroimidazol reductase NimA-like FMN-containing flavoprotein (pyridoxamine 5'-phosphate oxidase superfamily)